MIDQESIDRIHKVRAELILTRRFYGVLVSQVEPVPSRKFPTMATNSKQHFFNPDFIATLNHAELLGVQCHETEHDARHHGTRRNGRDPVKWNEACDYSINIDLVDEGFTLPKGALIDPRFRGLSAEDIYRIRELEAEQKRKQQQQDEPEDQGKPDDDGDDDDGSSDAPADDADKDDGDQDDGDEGSDAGDDGDEGDDGEEGDDQGDQGDGDDGSSDAPSDDGKPGEAQGTGSGDADGDEGEPGEGSGGEQGDDEGDGEAQGTSSGDPGMCGEVLDSAEDAAEIADKDIEWERIVRQAASMAKGCGQLPGHVSREIERASNPPRNWRDELREFCEQGALRIETWNRPNRRFMGRGLMLPSTQKDGVSKAVFLIDTSGSMDAIALAAINNEAQAMLDDGVIDEVVAVYGDTEVTRVDEYRSGDQIIFDPRGGGGTDLKPLFAHVAQNIDDATLLICFTDLDIGDPGPEPHCPVLFAVTGHPVRVRANLECTPWGARGIDVGSH
jgi:predicted metal-dependent peptidase